MDRIARFAEEIDSANYDAYLIGSPVTSGYLTGFAEGAGERFMVLAVRRNGEMRLICPALSESQALRCNITDVRSWRDGEDPLVHFRELIKDWGLKSSIVAVDDEMPAAMLLEMQAVVPGALFRAGSHLVNRLMRIKDQQEIEWMRQAGAIADAAFEAAIPQISAGMTEVDIEAILTHEMQVRGGKPTFCIIAGGESSAEPHHINCDRPLQTGDAVILDFGCSVNGYQADITRMVSVGPASPEVQKAYKLVYDAHMAARKAIRPGIPAESIDQKARQVIEQAGYGEFFIHRTGHGIGLRVHEEPNIVAGNKLPLQAGHCFSIEPGVYFPGKFGIRIENIVAVTNEGHESMNAEPAAEIIEF